MCNEEVLKKMQENMEMRKFSPYTKYAYMHKTKETMKYFKEKKLEQVTTDELREYLLKYLKEERKLSDRSVNYYNSVIRFVFFGMFFGTPTQNRLIIYA